MSFQEEHLNAIIRGKSVADEISSPLTRIVVSAAHRAAVNLVKCMSELRRQVEKVIGGMTKLLSTLHSHNMHIRYIVCMFDVRGHKCHDRCL